MPNPIFGERQKDGTQKLVGGGLEIRFSDGGHARMFGSVQFNLPTDEKSLNNIHSNYRGNDAVVKNLVETVVQKSIYLSGTLMTSKESYAEKRNDLIHYITDQIQNGVYKTRQTKTWVKDELTQQSKEIIQAEIIHDKAGLPERQENSVLNDYSIKAFNFTITTMPYDDTIEAQIKQQQGLAMAVQTKIAEARQAEQAAVTAKAEGEANAIKSKWEQEVIKSKAIVAAQQEKEVAVTNANREKEVAETAAQQRLNVADLDKKAAELQKARAILIGEGDAKAAELRLAADGALKPKIDAYIEAQKLWSSAFRDYKGNIVPGVVMGGSGTAGTSGNNAVQQFMELQNAKALVDLGLNMNMNQQAPKK